jgi:hypothetical protein
MVVLPLQMTGDTKIARLKGIRSGFHKRVNEFFGTDALPLCPFVGRMLPLPVDFGAFRDGILGFEVPPRAPVREVVPPDDGEASHELPAATDPASPGSAMDISPRQRRAHKAATLATAGGSDGDDDVNQWGEEEVIDFGDRRRSDDNVDDNHAEEEPFARAVSQRPSTRKEGRPRSNRRMRLL